MDDAAKWADQTLAIQENYTTLRTKALVLDSSTKETRQRRRICAPAR